MRNLFELASGCIVGTHHQELLSNCQDYSCWYQNDGLTIAIVADGCGSTSHSEVGAFLGSKLLLANIQKYWGWDDENIFTVLFATLEDLKSILGAKMLPEDVFDSMLFTLAGCIIADSIATFFCIGDGVIIINGSEMRFESPENKPSYLGYVLTGQKTLADIPVFNYGVDVGSLESFLVGTDGVTDLIDHSDKCLPGKPVKLGDISQFWTDDRYYSNPEITNRLLRLANTSKVRFDPVTGDRTNIPGILPDDTTLIVGRRRVILEEN